MPPKPDYLPFYRPEIGEEEIAEVTACLRSGWLTTGRLAHRLEADFAAWTGAKAAVAVNSCTAALHLALEALGLKADELVLVPTLTFAATAEVVRYFNAIPVLVDVRDEDFNIDLGHAERILDNLAAGRPVPGVPARHGPVRGIIPVHYGGQTVDVLRARALCDRHGLFLVEDCAHCGPAYYRDADGAWTMAGRSADIACYSFYANKTITTGEGGMATTEREDWADRMRIMALHGISRDAWKRFTREGSWYYEIVAPGFKYNLPDTAAAIGVHQLAKADRFWEARRAVVARYHEALADIPGIRLPFERPDARHSWHLYVIRVNERIAGIGRNAVIDGLKAQEIGTSVHYLPLHLHPYYRETYGYRKGHLPVAEAIYEEIVSLPIFPGMTEAETARVCAALHAIVPAAHPEISNSKSQISNPKSQIRNPKSEI